MNENNTKNRNLLERFSSTLLGRGKKSRGHKTLLESLFFFRQNEDKALLYLLLQKNKVQEKKPKRDLQSDVVHFHPEKLSKNQIDFERNKNNKKIIENKKNFGKIEGKDHLQNKKFSTELLSSKMGLNSLLNKSICKICVDNVKPILETRKVRKGRITYRVPLVTQTRRQEFKAVSFLIENATLRKKSVSLNFQRFLETKDSKSACTLNLKIFDSNSLSLQPENLVKNVSQSGKAQSNMLSNTLSSPNFQRDKVKNLLNFSSEKELFFFSSLKRLNLYSIKYTLCEEFSDSFLGKGESVDKKKQLHSLALQNRAYTHYRWW